MTQRLFLNKDLGAGHCGGLGRQGPSLTSVKRTERQGVCRLRHEGCGRKVQVVSLCCTFLPRVGVLGRPGVPRAEHSPQSLKWPTTLCGFTPWRGKGLLRVAPLPYRKTLGARALGELGGQGRGVRQWLGWLVATGAEASRPLPGGWARLGPQEITIITK